MNLRTVRTYQDNFSIACDDSTDLYHCLKDASQMKKSDGKPAAYKNLTLAEKFIKANGALEVEKPEKQAWTAPEPATIAPLEEQLATLSADAPRFVVIEKGYGFYHEQGYAVYDRQEQEIVSTGTYNGWNNVTQSREEAEKEASYRMEHPPVKVKIDMSIANALFRAEETARKNRIYGTAAPSDETTVTINTREQVGSIIEFERKQWLVTQSEYVSAEEANEAEEGFDVFVCPGWHTTLVSLDAKVMSVLSEQYEDGAASFPSSDTVKFADEEQASKLVDLAYFGQIGLYDKTKVSL